MQIYNTYFLLFLNEIQSNSDNLEILIFWQHLIKIVPTYKSFDKSEKENRKMHYNEDSAGEKDL